jgi:RNA polymerase sigma factor (sigma-70 family)
MSDRSSALTTGDSADDPSVIRRVAAGDRAAFEGLMRRHNRRLYRIARAILRDDTEAEDALQDAYLDAFRSAAQFRGEAAVSTWLARLVINECLARSRRDARRRNVIPLIPSADATALEAIVADESHAPDLAADRAHLRAILERRMDELPETFRLVFILRSVEELSVEETAQCLGLPQETVRSRHFRARGLLREALARDIDLAERDVFEFGGERCDRVIAKVLALLPR